MEKEPQVYVYDTNDWTPSAAGRALDWALGLRYMAYSAPWPEGRRLSWGRTPEQARRKGVRELLRNGSFGSPKRVL
jgi:hypothetical protein